MARVLTLSWSDTFDNQTSSPISLEAHNNPNLDWTPIVSPLINNIFVQPADVITPSTSSPRFASYMALTPNPAGVAFDAPNWALMGNMKPSVARDFDAIFVGLFADTRGLFIGGGYATAMADLTGGESSEDVIFPAIVKIKVDGSTSQFTLQGEGFFLTARDPPQNQVFLLAGGPSVHARTRAGVAFGQHRVAFSRYEVTYSPPPNWVPATVPTVLRLVAHPPELLQTALATNAAGATTWQPAIFMRSGLAASGQAEMTSFFADFYKLTPRHILPEWQPLEDLFIVRVELDFLDVDPIFTTTERTQGPYHISPPTYYREVSVLAKMVVLDNAANPSHMRLSIGTLEYSIPPLTRFQLVLPAVYLPILVDGGGSNGVLYLLSEIIAHSFDSYSGT